MPLPPPPADPRSAPHWEAARRGILLLERCPECSSCRFPAARECAQCHHVGGEWIEASGEAVIISFCTFHKAYWPQMRDRLPYSVIQVRLAEGVDFMSNLVDAGGRSPAIGMPVRATFVPASEELTLVCFRPAD